MLEVWVKSYTYIKVVIQILEFGDQKSDCQKSEVKSEVADSSSVAISQRSEFGLSEVRS